MHWSSTGDATQRGGFCQRRALQARNRHEGGWWPERDEPGLEPKYTLRAERNGQVLQYLTSHLKICSFVFCFLINSCSINSFPEEKGSFGGQGEKQDPA